MSKNITDPNYSLMSLEDFFGIKDPVRLVIIIYIFISLILNIFIFVIVSIIHFKKKVFSLGILVTCAILFVNFAHTFAYFFQWVIKDNTTKYIINNNNGENIEVGGLLTGNPSHFSACTAQAFILISSSISQDFIINIFFYMVTKNEKEIRKGIITISLLILGLVFPIGFTLFYYFIGSLGLNDKFCYVAKFTYSINNNIVKYEISDNFKFLVMIVYGIRVVNFCVTFFFLIKIIKYVKKTNMSKTYIFKSIIIPIIQLFTILIGVLYRLLIFFSYDISYKISWLYLVLNTSDGVLFPIIFMFKNNIISNLKNLFSGNIVFSEGENNRLLDDDEE